MISIKNLSFCFGEKQVFKDFSLNVKSGERICISAPSGYGKTTLLRLIMGLEKPQSGTVNTEKGTRFSCVFQEDRLIPQKDALGNLTVFGEKEAAKSLLAELELTDSQNKYPAALSGGMKRRLSIARALLSDADIYIFDEPFSGLDEEIKQKTAALINKKTADKTVILVSHDLADAALLNTKIIEL